MKKRFFVFTLLFTLLMGINVFAYSSDFNSFIEEYGVSGTRYFYYTDSSNRSVAIRVISDYSVLVILNTRSNRLFMLSNHEFQYGYSQNNGTESITNINSTSNPFNDSNLQISGIFSASTNVYKTAFSNMKSGSMPEGVDVIFDGTKSSFDSWMEEHPTNENDPNIPDSNNLPMLQYGLTKKTVLGFPQITQIKEILTWDYASEDIYKNNPTDFHMELVASARWTSSPTGIGNIRDTSDKSINQNCKVYITNGGCNISVNQYSWIYREIGKSLYAISGEPWDDNSGYFMYVRTVQDSTGKTSAWKVYNLAMNGLVVQEDTFIEPDGTQKPLPNNQIDIGNGQGVQPAKFDNDSSTSSDSDPTSIRYDEGSGNFNAGTVISTLKSTVNQVSELPTVLTQLLAFLPSWLTSLIVIGIGLAVTIGIVKMILH